MTIYPAYKAQIVLFIAKKITVLAKYTDFSNIFLKELAEILPERISINKYAIKLEDDEQSSYGTIYSQGLVELKTFKIYINTNWANGFI